MPTIFRDKVIAGAVTFNDPTAPQVGAVTFGIDNMDGWKKAPSREVRSVPFGGSVDGEEAIGYWAAFARHMIIEGWAVCTDRISAESIEDIILGDAFPANEELVIVRFEGIPKYVRVRVEGEVEVINTGPNAFRFSVPVQTVGSPWKFSYNPLDNETGTAGAAGISSGGRAYPRTYPLQYTTVSSGAESQVVINNHGTAPTDPFITITGPLPQGSWRIENQNNADYIRFDVGLLATDVLTIDFASRTAMLNGYLVTSKIDGDFWKIDRGVNIIKMFAPFDPAAQFTVSINSAWR